MSREHMKRCSTSAIIKERQIKTTFRYHHLWEEWLSSKTTNSKCWRECGKGKLLTLLVGMQIDTTTMDSTMEILFKSRNETTIWPSNPTTGHIP